MMRFHCSSPYLWFPQTRFPEIEALASGAVLSTYQRTRVESVCARLGLTSLGYLWQVPPRLRLYIVDSNHSATLDL